MGQVVDTVEHRRLGLVRTTDDADAARQTSILASAGCTSFELRTGAPSCFSDMLSRAAKGDVFVVARFDRIARSVPDLICVLSGLDAAGASLISVGDGFDSATAHGRAMRSMLTAVSELQRGIVRERTREGLAAARSQGRIFGNPEMRRGDPDAIDRMRRAQADAYTRRARERSTAWLHLVALHRPASSWDAVLRLVHDVHPGTRDVLTVGSMVRDARRLVDAGDLSDDVLQRAPSAPPDPAATARRIVEHRPESPLRAVARELDVLGIRPPRAASWTAGAVSRLLERSA